MAPLRLTDGQMATVINAARPLPPDKRSVLLERIAGNLQQLGYLRVSESDLECAVRLALQGLLHAPAA